ncbi:MAG: hypothetical protein LC102_09020 [Ignavibacteriales bacterium]|jgi:hypothetical protein|nr:MAG: hypothetical protein F9K26_05315 [Ignavibacteriaceae bacterium]MBW7872835.1 hypothetical protein [Ignavibacteria bacterium]MCZ2143555.1 hypothetical protein [Ignavibacteriales bacterium]OQY75780.1 MAG: hypothetical protein B6D45_05180 [Ignavibacteriales bacterium UTCHB3]MBV6444430.1 hypothetical protein [Ignavibacteriaceae bacterium]
METKLNETVNIQSGEVLPGVSLGAGGASETGDATAVAAEGADVVGAGSENTTGAGSVPLGGTSANASAVPVGAKKPVATEDEANATVQSGGEVNGAVPSGVEVKDTVPSEDLGQNSASGGTVGAVDGVPNIPVGGGTTPGQNPASAPEDTKNNENGAVENQGDEEKSNPLYNSANNELYERLKSELMEEIRKYFDPFLKGAQGGSVSGTGNQEGFSPGAGSGKGADVDMGAGTGAGAGAVAGANMSAGTAAGAGIQPNINTGAQAPAGVPEGGVHPQFILDMEGNGGSKSLVSRILEETGW